MPRTIEDFAVGQRVETEHWGQRRQGTVVQIGPRSPLVFVRLDGGCDLRIWREPAHLTPLSGKGAPTSKD